MCPRGAERRLPVFRGRAAITERRPPGDAHGASGIGGPARDQARAASQKGDGVARQPPDFGEDVAGRGPLPGASLPADGVDGRRAGARESGEAADGRGLREHGPAPGVAAAAAPQRARVAPPEPARRPAPPPAPARKKKVLPEAARAALFDRLQRPASAPVKKRAVKSGPTWIIKSEPRPEYVAPPRKSLKSADARKVVERLYTADCARREERVQANAKAYFRPAKRRRRKGKKAVRSFLSRLRRSDAKRKKRLKAIRDAVFAAERGVERTAEDAVGLQNLSRLAAAPASAAADAAPTGSTCELSFGVLGFLRRR